ncbi:MAG: hypothetical protein JWR89_1339 [Tardiphaga sp.]|uniref:hypothetical protein n=1 Tax=Tardiphaga sp. TaxID=1926292 RepID=UPI002601BEC0|nr:hypothetical protein [Tardiphaga sp.]MDB5501437.1 hypothetical protein [Tardiphaga sp.]
MADIMSILASGYTASALATPSNTPYTNVDAASYNGNWDGTYSSGETFKFAISNVTGFRAQVKYQSGTTMKYQSVLIKDNSFRVGDSKFTLSGAGKATVKTAVTDPVTSSTSLVTGTATQET